MPHNIKKSKNKKKTNSKKTKHQSKYSPIKTKNKQTKNQDSQMLPVLIKHKPYFLCLITPLKVRGTPLLVKESKNKCPTKPRKKPTTLNKTSKPK